METPLFSEVDFPFAVLLLERGIFDGLPTDLVHLILLWYRSITHDLSPFMSTFLLEDPLKFIPSFVFRIVGSFLELTCFSYSTPPSPQDPNVLDVLVKQLLVVEIGLSIWVVSTFHIELGHLAVIVEILSA